MKTLLALLLCLSIAANVLLVRRGSNPSETSDITPPAAAPAPVPSFVLNDALWQKAATGDTASLQAIRDSGLPPETIRALLRSAISEMFKARRDALNPPDQEPKYWTSKYMIGAGPKNRTALLDLRREEQALVEKWLPNSGEEQRTTDPTTPYLAPQKAKQLAEIEEDYRALIADVRGNSGQGYNQILLPEDREKLAYLQKEKAKELAELLSPSELEEYNVRNSSTANNLRYELAAFNPTEAEFRTIEKIRRETVDDKFSGGQMMLTPEERTARMEAQKLADQQIKTVLGEQRYADYTRAQDFDYRTLAQITDHLQLPKDRAVEAYKVKTDLEQQFRAMAPQTNEERIQAVTSLVQVADREFTRILGEKGYAVYKQYGNLPRMAQSILNPPRPTPRPKG